MKKCVFLILKFLLCAGVETFKISSFLNPKFIAYFVLGNPGTQIQLNVDR